MTSSHYRWASGDTSKRAHRRIAILASSWSPWLVAFLALTLLLALRSSIVRFLGEGGGTLGAAVRGLDPEQSAAVAARAAGAARAPRYQVRTHCSNTCFKALDGVCDEGRPPSNPTSQGRAGQGDDKGRARGLLSAESDSQVSELYCDLGTDCGDCGPWVGTVPGAWDSFAGPVAWLRKVHNASVFSRATSTPLSFLAAITNHSADPDVSSMLWHFGAMEGGVTRVLHHTLGGHCVPEAAAGGAGSSAGGVNGRRRRMVVDVGANFGYYTVQAALYGCRVVAFEPVRKFRAYLEWSLHAAGVAELVHVAELALSDEEGPLTLVLPKDGAYWGLTSVHGVNVMPSEVRETLTVNATTLDRWEAWAPSDAKPSDVILLKMDTEGWEANVLRGGSRLLAEHVDVVLLEYSPGIYERNNMSDLRPQSALPNSLLALSRAGFSLAHLPLFEFAAPWPPRPIDPEEPLPPLAEVTEKALLHDLEAIEYRHRMEVDPGGCPLPAELKDAYPVWRHCREWMYGVHPKGFRSAFGFNTNVWAARARAAGRQYMRLQGSAALFDEAQDMRTWTSTSRPGVGLALANCSFIGAGHLQLFRCPCPPSGAPECAAEQQLVAQLAAEGKMPFTAIQQ